MTIIVDHWDNDKYGFPAGARRRVTPIALACIHITGNRSTASDRDYHRAARNEYNYAKRAAPPSAHYYIARDGWALEAIHPVRYAAWSNGDVQNPDRDVPGIRKVLAMMERGYNANEAYWLEFECVGYGSEYRITTKQKQTMARVIADHAKRTGLAISRATVHAHADLNSVNRSNCPISPRRREAFLADVIERARAIVAPPAPEPPAPEPPPPPPQEEPDMKVVRVKGEDWRPRTGILRAAPDASAAVVATFDAGAIVRTISEVAGNDGGSWRLTEHNGSPAFLLYRTRDGAPGDWDPVVQGGDAAVDALLDHYIARGEIVPAPELILARETAMVAYDALGKLLKL